ncbi:hypothetical protein QOZ80_1BG0091530 [Eleusine coracana subsp. coracana]|nr:hypothetical protein QOZ80_1BG0091530 [Eleusine coracana subsp. coracana]
MGGLCSKGSAVDKSPSDTTLGPGRVLDHHEHGLVKEEKKTVVEDEAVAKRTQEQLQPPQQEQPMSVSQTAMPGGAVDAAALPWDGVPPLARLPSQKSGMGVAKASVAKVSEVSSILGRASTAGIGKAVDVLDTLGSSMTNLNMSGFGSGTTTKGNKITILAFEVANTVVKGCNVMRALSKDSVRHLKEVVLHSEGVQNLISKDMDELLKIAVADKREELKVFSTEVVRFGNRCKDPQWHNLDRYFDKLLNIT